MSKKVPIAYEVGEDIELSEAEVADFDARMEQAEKDIEEARVNFRWGASQVILVKKVAAKIGIPYQTYIKQAVLRQATQDLEQLDKLEQLAQ